MNIHIFSYVYPYEVNVYRYEVNGDILSLFFTAVEKTTKIWRAITFYFVHTLYNLNLQTEHNQKNKISDKNKRINQCF